MLPDRLVLVLLFLSLTVLSGCGTVSYYSQAIGGHLELMRARQPISELLASDETDPALREQLQTLQGARRFAIDALGLPENDSYASYAATNREYVTWNVVAADEFSVDARTWCFPIAGCVNYRGYFDEQAAERYAASLEAEGPVDVIIGGASAYSTLGWFDDPVLDTMLRGGDTGYVGTLFHELAHQKLYVKDDSNFNEAFASFVEQEGVREWLAMRDEPGRVSAYDDWLERRGEFSRLLKTTRELLETLYERDLDDDAKRLAKQKVFDGMLERYEALKESWSGYAGYDGWFERELNNARLVSVATYRRYIPAFQAVFIEAGGRWGPFYERVQTLSELPRDERRERMEAYLKRGAASGKPGQGA